MSPKVIIISLVVFFGVTIAGALLFSASQKPPATSAAYSDQDVDRPRAEVAENFFDLGEMSVKDIKTQDFTLKNSGTKPLQITNVSSSCGCTTGQIIYKGETSNEFSMHQKSGYVTEIAPQDEAIVRLTYRPATMPVYGPVEREVYVDTNDPANSKLTFKIKATVK